jgi:hypothetical protein
MDDPLKYLTTTYGEDWRDRPLLLEGLWNATSLSDRRRRLSLQGLLKENLTIPFFSDATRYGALSPDSKAPVHEIVDRISKGFPHKIGTQLLVQTYPELMEEVAPVEILTKLFGNHFTENKLLGRGRILGIFPGTTTVPVFVANGRTTPVEDSKNDGETPESSSHPITGLHCEPIGNVAVQLSGVKAWTLIDPKYSFKLQPSAAPDGRAFFASWAPGFDHVPRYEVKTYAGDAIWVPTWTWHRVDYAVESNDISIGGSLFHFRPIEFVRLNPLYAVLVIPAIIKELLGMNTQ